jgi:hypothetical protein
LSELLCLGYRLGKVAYAKRLKNVDEFIELHW